MNSDYQNFQQRQRLNHETHLPPEANANYPVRSLARN